MTLHSYLMESHGSADYGEVTETNALADQTLDHQQALNHQQALDHQQALGHHEVEDQKNLSGAEHMKITRLLY